MSINKLFNVINTQFNLLYINTSSFIVYCILKLKGVSIGRKCKFMGYLKVTKLDSSNIIIGCNNRFLSSRRGNGYIYRKCIITSVGKNSKVEIGNNNGLSGAVIACSLSIRLGNHIKIGANTLITDSDWHPEDFRSGRPQPVIIEDNVWLGSDVVVLKGVHIGENTVVSANSVVFESLPSNVIAAGNPCKVIFDPFKKIMPNR